jgi:rRNA maturation endonuclease Nob1
MRRAAAPAAVEADDPAEAAVRAYRAAHRTCATCGPRPETDATYCSDCGRFLPARCQDCKAIVTAAGARYCPDCGHRLAA